MSSLYTIYTYSTILYCTHILLQVLLVVCITLLYDPALTYADLASLAVLFHIYPYTLHHSPTFTTAITMSTTTTGAKTSTIPITDTPYDSTSALGRGNNNSSSTKGKPSYDSIVTSGILAITLSIAGCPVLTILWLKTGGANANYLFFAGMMVWLCCGFIVAKLYRMTPAEVT